MGRPVYPSPADAACPPSRLAVVHILLPAIRQFRQAGPPDAFTLTVSESVNASVRTAQSAPREPFLPNPTPRRRPARLGGETRAVRACRRGTAPRPPETSGRPGQFLQRRPVTAYDAWRGVAWSAVR